MEKRRYLENFRLLKEDMEKNGWIIDAFEFKYKKENYVILPKLFIEKGETDKYALLKIEIIDTSNTQKHITIPVNSHKFLIGVKELRIFFNIEFSENLGDALQQFYQYFSTFIPTQINPQKSELLKEFMISSLSKSDSENPDKIYCFAVKRNPEKVYRSPYNDNKSKILRPDLYSQFKNDPTISFCYSIEKNDEKSDAQILLNFSRRG